MQARDWQAAEIAVWQLLHEYPKFAGGWCEAAGIALILGRPQDAQSAAAEAQRHAGSDPQWPNAIGPLFSRAGDQHRALAAYDAAVALAPDNAHFIFNLAAVHRFLGQLTEAGQDQKSVIALVPKDFEAYRNRSGLCTQTAGKNHVTEIKVALATVTADRRGDVQLR